MIAFLIVLLTFAFIGAIAILPAGWLTMLCLGGLAHIFSVPTLAIGFWPSCLVAIIIFVLFGS